MQRFFMLSVLLSASPTLYGALGSWNPNELFYYQDSTDGFYFFEVCSNHLPGPQVNCPDDDKAGTPLPALVAFEEKDFNDALLQAGDFGYDSLTGNDKARYLGEDGEVNIRSDIANYEIYAKQPDLKVDAIAKTQEKIDLLLALSNANAQSKILFAQIKSPSTKLVPAFDEQLQLAKKGLEKVAKQLLIFEPTYEIWWRYLGEGDFYDATGSFRYDQRGDAALNQTKHPGCVKRYGANYRLPTPSEIRAMSLKPHVRTAVQKSFGIQYQKIWTNAGETLEHYDSGPSTNKATYKSKSETGSILCVINNKGS